MNSVNHRQVQFQSSSSSSRRIYGGATEAGYIDSVSIGYRFLPTDQELIIHFLRNKIQNQKLPGNMIKEADVYGNHPRDLAVHYPQAKEGVWYFFSKRYMRYRHGNRPSRSAGFGYWKGMGVDKVIRVNGKRIGARKTLAYHEGHQPNGTKTIWMMHEYVVNQGDERQQLDSDYKKFDDYVLCKIYKNVRQRRI